MKSLLLSLVLTIIICIYCMGLFDARVRHFISGLSAVFFVTTMIIFFVGYVLSLYWAVTGIVKGQLLLNLPGLCLALFGIGIYLLGYQMESGKGKAAPGQFDHAISKIEPGQQAALLHLMKQTGTTEQEVQLVTYWAMYNNSNSFVICVQHGNIIALQLKNKTLTDMADISALPALNWLVLHNCGITSVAALQLPLLQRLDVAHNQLATLQGVQNAPDITWLNFRDNPVTDSSALQQIANKAIYITGK